MVRAEVHELAWIHAQECNDAAVVLLRQCHITQPVIKARFHLQVDHPRLHSSAQRIHDGTVGLQVASSTFEYTFVQFVHAHHVIQHDLVAGGLNALWSRVELVEEHEPAVLASRQRCAHHREHIEWSELGFACLLVEAGQAIQVRWIAHRQTNVDQLQVVVLGQLSHDGRFTDARAGLDERCQSGIEAALHKLTDLAWGGRIDIGHSYLL